LFCRFATSTCTPTLCIGAGGGKLHSNSEALRSASPEQRDAIPRRNMKYGSTSPKSQKQSGDANKSRTGFARNGQGLIGEAEFNRFETAKYETNLKSKK